MLALSSLLIATPVLQPVAIDWEARASALEAQVNQLKTQLNASHSSTGLSVSVQVAPLDGHGAIPMPNNTSHVVLEIGCSDRNTLDEELLPPAPPAFLVSFEPMLDKYAVLLARGTTRYFGEQNDRAVPLGHHHQRGVVLPIAITPHGGAVAFNIAKTAGCSSTLTTTPNSTW